MTRDRLFRQTTARSQDFEFNEEVARIFDDMLVRSIPMYLEQHCMIRDLARLFWTPDTNIYDLGCSTGTTLCNIARALRKAPRLVGLDSSRPLLAKARAKIARAGLEKRVSVDCLDLNGDLGPARLEHASIVTMCWTLQFVRPLNRDRVVKWIYDGLVDGGALIVTEKILTGSSDMNRVFIELYYDFKKRNRYSSDEIRRKRDALENVLVPYRTEENVELFRRNGFEVVETFFQWYNFAGYVCLKSGASRRRP